MEILFDVFADKATARKWRQFTIFFSAMFKQTPMASHLQQTLLNRTAFDKASAHPFQEGWLEPVLHTAFEHIDEEMSDDEEENSEVPMGEFLGSWAHAEYEALGFSKTMAFTIKQGIDSVQVFSQHFHDPPALDPCSRSFGTPTIINVDFIVSELRAIDDAAYGEK
jgi:hypothetical protein